MKAVAGIQDAKTGKSTLTAGFWPYRKPRRSAGILNKKGVGNFVSEVSMDETDEPQSPEEFIFILAALADEKVILQTIAPKFTGRFNRGKVDSLPNNRRFGYSKRLI